MRRREPPVNPGDKRIPAELYAGIDPHAFALVLVNERNGDVRSEGAGEHHRWSASVRAAGWTVGGIRKAAARDAGYQRWLRNQERRRRSVEEDRA